MTRLTPIPWTAFENNWHVIFDAATKVENAPNRWLVSLYFLGWIFISTMVIMNLLVSHFLQTFSEMYKGTQRLRQHAKDAYLQMERGKAVYGNRQQQPEASEESGRYHRRGSDMEALRAEQRKQRGKCGRAWDAICQALWGWECALTGEPILGEDVVYMMAPQLCTYEPVAVNWRIALELLDPDPTSPLNRFIQREWNPKTSHSAMAHVRQDARIILGAEEADEEADGFDESEITDLYRAATSVEMTYQQQKQESQSLGLHSRTSSFFLSMHSLTSRSSSISKHPNDTDAATAVDAASKAGGESEVVNPLPIP